MRMKLIVGGLLTSVALYPAIAQQSPAPAPAPSPPAQRMEPTPPAQRTPMATTGQWRASKLVGVDVYNTANEKIGDIEEILIDASGKVTSVIIGVGGFLGMGQHDVQVQLSELKFVNEPRRDRHHDNHHHDNHHWYGHRRCDHPHRSAPRMSSGIPTTPS